MPQQDVDSTSVVFLCGDASNGNIAMCASSLFSKVIHEVASDGDDLIGLCRDGCYNLSTALPVFGCDFKASHFCTGKDAHFVLSSSQSKIYSWGEGSYGELGLGCCKTKADEPTAIKHKASFSSISCGECHGAALDLSGNAYSWGQNFDRQLGLYRKDSCNFRSSNCVVEEIMFVPSLLPFSLKCPILKISCGARFTVAVGINGDLWSWGAGECGQLGTGRCTRREAPTIISFPYTESEDKFNDKNDPNTTSITGTDGNRNSTIRIIDIACGASHVIAIADDCSVYGWGMNIRGQLGLGDSDTRHSPTILPGTFLQKAYADGNSSAGINSSGELYTWGSGSSYRLMHMIEVEGGETQGFDSHWNIPTYVECLYGNIVHSFVFARTSSAALVITRLYELSPPCGPQKSFNELQIHGCGFWDSDSIVVTFTSAPKDVLDAYAAVIPKPRSCQGRLIAPGVISCKPPRLAESGAYDVTVALNGIIFVNESLPLTVYQDVVVCALSPKLLDRRNPDETKIRLTVRGLPLPSYFSREPEPGPESEPEPEPESSVEYDVKLVFSPLSSNRKQSYCNISKSNIYETNNSSRPNLLKNDFIVIVRGILQQNNKSEKSDGSSSILPFIKNLEDPDGVAESTGGSQESYIICDIKTALDSFSSLSLFCIRAQISLNGSDFSAIPGTATGNNNGNGSINDNNNMIICHSFHPMSISPTSCQCPLTVSGENAVLKEICVKGESFFSSKHLPSTLHLQATISYSLSLEPGTGTEFDKSNISDQIGQNDKSEKKIVGNGSDNDSNISLDKKENIDPYELEIVSIVVPVRCTSQEELYFTPPTLNQILSLFKSKNFNKEISSIRTWVQFQMLTTADITVPGGSKNLRSSAQIKKLSFNSSLESAVNVAPGSSPLEGIVKSLSSPLGTIIENRKLTLDLFNPQPIIISPSVCRRPGGTVLTIRGALEGGLRCLPYPDLVKVLLGSTGAEIELALSVPHVRVLTIKNNALETFEQEYLGKNDLALEIDCAVGLLQQLGGDGKDGDSSGAEHSSGVSREGSPIKATKVSLDYMKAVVEDEEEVDKVGAGEEEGEEEEEINTDNTEFRIRFEMPDLSVFFSDVEAAVGAAPDSILVTLLLDGESRVPINHSYKIMLFDGIKVGNVINPKGGYTYGSQACVGVIGLPDIISSCIVRIRGDDKEKDKDKEKDRDRDREKGSTIPPRTVLVPLLLYTDTPGIKSKSSSGSTEITFTIPDSERMMGMIPIVVKKVKMFFVEISVDGGSSFDSSVAPIIQIQ